MTARDPVSDEDLQALLDGELPAARAAAVAACVDRDAALQARLAAFRADKAALKAAYRGIAEAPVPPAWIARISQAVDRAPERRARPRALGWAASLAACLAVALGVAALRQARPPAGDTILVQAEAARRDTAAPTARLHVARQADASPLDAVLSRAVGLKLRAPDLARLGWRLAELDTYADAAALRYEAQDGRLLTVFVRRSTGAARFDLLKHGALRICIWQDEVLGAVLMGEMSAGQMMRAAAVAYVALNS